MTFEFVFPQFLQSNLAKPNTVSPNKVPQSGEPPFLVYQLVTAQRESTHDGNDQLVWAEYQFDCYAKKKQSAVEVMQELRELIEDYDGYINGVRVQGCFLIDQFDTYEENSKLYREEREYRIQYKE